MIDRKLGAYRITEEIGAGGMATVFRAYQASMDRHVAIKVIRGSILQNTTVRDRFRREARLIARLEHPHLLPVYDFDGDHDPPYIVMRYLEGGTLKQVLAQGELPFGEMLYMLNQVAAALDYAHRQGVVHRDLKPSNVMIDREGNAFVTDFGIARVAGSGNEALTGEGDLVGTPAYMSPEQARGQADVDSAADIYALGVLVFEMLTQTVPYAGDSGLGVLMSHLNDPVPSARERDRRVPESADRVLRRAMAKDRAARHRSAEELVADLTAALDVSRASSPRRLQEMTETLSLDQLKALEAKRVKTGETPSSETPSEQQRQMTSVHFDVAELSALLYESGREAETVRPRMDALWTRFDEVAREYGGVIQSRTDDVGVALWGRSRIHEDDPERAVRAALKMRDAVADEARAVLGSAWEPTEESPLPFSAGVSTGPVLLERSAETGTWTASGAAITLAGRIQDAAPPGAILIAHDTFTQVRGVFTITEHDPIRIRGRKEPLEVYAVLQVKPRAFRLKARGIEGVETRMIGREIELRLLQEAFTLTLEDGETQVVTVVGEAGVGKSRLLFEFSAWGELIEQQFWQFEARATAPSMMQPYSLTRDLFSFRFQILDSDPLDVVHRKFVDGVAQFLGPNTAESAELIGQLVGFDFSNRPAVADALKDAEGFRRRALGLLGDFFTAATRESPVVIHVEDIHWADDRSLDLLNHLVRENAKLPLFVLCMARPSFYERRPQWGEGQRFHERIQLEPLSQLSSRRLVRELLKKMAEVPPELRDLIVERADGNPFYIEELIKALIDDGLILKGDEAWTVDGTRLSTIRIPPTLTGVLQSRLDALPLPLQLLLQRASVIGRIFWDRAVIALSRETGLDDEELQAMLEDLRAREMILRREQSGFAGTVEYVFRHAILRDVTYGTLVPRQRRALHVLAAEWLLEVGGARAGEYTLAVAEHLEQAGEPARAAEQLRRAGDAAVFVGAYDDAETLLRRARGLASAPDHRATRFAVDLSLAELASLRGQLESVWELMQALVPEAREAGDKSALARALGMLARVTMWRNDIPTAGQYLEEALPITREVGDERGLLFVLRQIGNTSLDRSRAAAAIEESLAIARRLGDRRSEVLGLNSLANLVTIHDEDPGPALPHYEQALRIARELKEPSLVALLVANLGAYYVQVGDLEAAEAPLHEAQRLCREIGDENLHGNVLENFAWLWVRRGDEARARASLVEALECYRISGVKPTWLLVLLAILEARRGGHALAVAWTKCPVVMENPTAKTMEVVHRQEIRGPLSKEAFHAAVAEGAAVDPEAVLDAFLAQTRAAAPATGA